MAAKKSGLSHKSAYTIMRKMVGRAQEVFSSAIAYKLTQDDISDRIRQDIRETGEYIRLPTWAKSHIDGYCEAKREEIYKYHLVWLMSLDGELVTSEMVDQRTAEEKGRLFRDFCRKCEQSVEHYKLHGGSCRQPPTFEEFSARIAHFTPSDYHTPWARIKGDFSRYVWKDSKGVILSDKPYDRRWVGRGAEGEILAHGSSEVA